jgi:integrase
VLVDHVPTVSPPKTERGARPIALDAGTVAELRDHRKRQVAERLAAGNAWANELGLVFTDELGAPVKPASFSKRFAALAAAAKLPKLPLKALRHSHATLAMAAGVHPRTVSDRLGHASIAFTLTTYTAAVPQLQRDAADTLAALVNG